MTEQRLVEIFKDHVAAFNARNWAALKDDLAPDVVYVEIATDKTTRGADEYVEAARATMDAFPDMTASLNAVYGCGTTVVAEITWEGTQTGALVSPLGSIPPSGKRATIRAVGLYTFDGEKLKELHHYFDGMAVLRDIGALPTVAMSG